MTKWQRQDAYDSGDCADHKKQGLNADCENIQMGRIKLVNIETGDIILEEWSQYADDSGLEVSDEHARLIEAAPRLLEALQDLEWKFIEYLDDAQCRICHHWTSSGHQDPCTPGPAIKALPKPPSQHAPLLSQ